MTHRPRTKPLLIFSYDDGPVQDYTKAFPIHTRYDVPAEINVVADMVGTSGFLSKAQLLVMQEAGFEIVGHTKSHKILERTRLARGAHAGDRKVYLSKVRLAGANCLLKDRGITESVRVTNKGTDQYGAYALLDSPLQNDFSEQAVIRLTDQELRREVYQGKQDLLKMGFDVTNFTFPFNHSDRESEQLVSRYYDSARSSGNYGVNLPSKINWYRLNAKDFMFLPDRKIAEILDETKEIGALSIFSAHTWGKFTTDKLKFTIKAATHRGIDIVTRKEAVKAMKRQ